MKRVIAPCFFIFLFVLPMLVACGEEPASGWEGQVKIPAQDSSHPQVREAAEQIWWPTATAAAAATATAIAQPTAAPTTTPDPWEGVRAIHKVESGETLSGIASKWGCPAEVIQAANRGLVTNPDQISIGWELKIPSC